MSYEYEFDDVEYYDDYGVLYLEVEPVFEDQMFDGYNGFGALQTYGDAHALADISILSATVFLYGDDGEEVGEVNLEPEEVLKKYRWVKELCLDRLALEDLDDYIRGR